MNNTRAKESQRLKHRASWPNGSHERVSYRLASKESGCNATALVAVSDDRLTALLVRYYVFFPSRRHVTNISDDKYTVRLLAIITNKKKSRPGTTFSRGRGLHRTG